MSYLDKLESLNDGVDALEERLTALEEKFENIGQIGIDWAEAYEQVKAEVVAENKKRILALGEKQIDFIDKLGEKIRNWQEEMAYKIEALEEKVLKVRKRNEVLEAALRDTSAMIFDDDDYQEWTKQLEAKPK